MILSAYAQASPLPRRLQIWVGLFDVEAPAQPSFWIDGQPVQPIDPKPMQPIRDLVERSPGKPLNHRGVYSFELAVAGRPCRLRIVAGDCERWLTVASLPEQLPQSMDDSFKLLLCSCYFQPEDGGGLLGEIAKQMPTPDLSLMAGDQVYLDLPLFEDLPEHDPQLTRRIGDKYRRNWASASLGVPGLEPVLGLAPVVCLPDDHEYWNNYPFAQKQLPGTWNAARRARWETAARNLYQDYQRPEGSEGALRIDIAPLKFLFLDTRSSRSDDFDALMAAPAMQALQRWLDDLLAARRDGEPAVGVLASGQALFIEPPTKESEKRTVDAELGNYAHFAIIRSAIETLADHGIPLLYITGDVHWGRVASGTDLSSGRTLLHEVICSPSRLIRTPFADQAKSAFDGLKGIFGKRDDWPRHSKPPAPPARFGSARRFQLDGLHGQRGDQLALLSFSRRGNGVELETRYYPIHGDKAVARSQSAGRIALRSY